MSSTDTQRVRSDVIPALVEKALGAPRAGTKKKAIELAAMLVEVENTGEGVMVSYSSLPCSTTHGQ